ncbi:MAG: hypothetical protein AB7F35_09255 [Acetobacteraceae bacterium]
MIYALLMLIAMAVLAADWLQSGAHMPLFVLAVIATAVFFALDITDPLTISL